MEQLAQILSEALLVVRVLLEQPGLERLAAFLVQLVIMDLVVHINAYVKTAQRVIRWQELALVLLDGLEPFVIPQFVEMGSWLEENNAMETEQFAVLQIACLQVLAQAALRMEILVI
jgi:hypothetical protein